MILDLEPFFSNQQWQMILTATEIAHSYGWEIYAVGGIVRDCLMALSQNLGQNLEPSSHFTDIDLVVDGGEKSGIKLAIALHQNHPEAKLQTYPKFQTALLEWTNFSLDIATARTEIYPAPGANPQVQSSSIHQDLYRRDFTINALAVRIMRDKCDRQLIDLFGGCEDLANHQIRAIRAGSFAEDPRRMFRAVRFAVRFNFQIDPATQTEIQTVTASGLHDAIGGSRLKAELHYIFAQSTFKKSIKKSIEMLRSLEQLGALRCVDPQIHLPQDFSLQVRRLRKWLNWFGNSDHSTHFIDAAEQLLRSYGTQVPKISSLQTILNTWESPLPSQVVKVLKNYEAIALIIVATQCSQSQRRIIWQYLTSWRSVKPLLSGEDLKNMGYSEGKTIGTLLAQIRDATLDRRILTREEAIKSLQSD